MKFLKAFLQGLVLFPIFLWKMGGKNLAGGMLAFGTCLGYAVFGLFAALLLSCPSMVGLLIGLLIFHIMMVFYLTAKFIVGQGKTWSDLLE